MSPRQYLNQAYRLDLKINSKLEQIEGLRSMAFKITSNISQEKLGGTKQHSPMENAIVNIISLKNEINTEVDSLINIKKTISEKISSISNIEQRLLLEFRYLCFNSWEEIAYQMNFSLSYIYKLHHLAIKSFEKIIRENELG